jgi:DNA-binding PadR family transcriptional regulator
MGYPGGDGPETIESRRACVGTSRDEQTAPISSQVFHILLSLSDRPRHGYGILIEVQDRTGGRVTLGTGTVYSVIKRMRSQGWIEESSPPGAADDDPRRRYYRLTGEGRRVVQAEAERLHALVLQARAKSVLPEANA